MIEMRWYVPNVGEKVLQYRQQYDATVRAGPATGGVFGLPDFVNMQWSEWKTVPLEAERNPDFP